jgi:hypothetical protein
LEHTLAYSGKPRRNEIGGRFMRIGRSLFVSFLAMLFVLLAACHRTSDEQAVRQALDAAEHAAETTDGGAFGDRLSEDFVGNRGEVDRKQLVNLLRLAHLRSETIHALLGPVTVEPRGERFVATFTVTLTSGGRLLPSDMGVYDVESAWRKEGGDWVCYSASWKRRL